MCMAAESYGMDEKEADELHDLGKFNTKVIREEAQLNSAKVREHQHEAIRLVTRCEEQIDEQSGIVPHRNIRDALGYVTMSDSSSRTTRNRARDRLCSHCARSGHEKNTCWQLVGYPKWMSDRGARISGRGASRGGGHGSSSGYGREQGQANMAHAISPHASAVSDLTPEQWKAITYIIHDKPS